MNERTPSRGCVMRRRWAGRWAWWAAPVLALAAVGVGGCATAGGEAREARFPKLSEIESRVTPSEAPEVDRPAPGRRAVATVQQVDMPLHTNLDDSWALTREGVLGRRAREVWNANGLRMGVMAMNEAEAFFRPVPYVTGMHQARLVSAAHPSTLQVAPRLAEPVPVDLSQVPGAEPEARLVKLDGGRVRLLMTMEPNAAGGVTVQLTPHHQVRRWSLEPRDPLEKDLDGRLFEELAVAIDLRRNEVLVLGLHWPWEGASDDAEQDEDEAADDDERERHEERPDAEDAEHPWGTLGERGPTLDNHLGRALFTITRGGRAMQSVMLIQVEPANHRGPSRRRTEPQAQPDALPAP